MQILFSLIQKLCALVMISVLADLLIPSGSMRKYVRLACGMLVLHIMVSQVFVLFGRAAPDIEAQQWNQLLGEMQADPQSAGQDAAFAAYHRQAERLILGRARALGMEEPTVTIGWDQAYRVAGVILRDAAPAVATSTNADSAIQGETADLVRIREGIAEMLSVPLQSVWIQKEGDGIP